LPFRVHAGSSRAGIPVQGAVSANSAAPAGSHRAVRSGGLPGFTLCDRRRSWRGRLTISVDRQNRSTASELTNEISTLTREPPWGIEPQTYALRVFLCIVPDRSTSYRYAGQMASKTGWHWAGFAGTAPKTATTISNGRARAAVGNLVTVRDGIPRRPSVGQTLRRPGIELPPPPPAGRTRLQVGLLNTTNIPGMRRAWSGAWMVPAIQYEHAASHTLTMTGTGILSHRRRQLREYGAIGDRHGEAVKPGSDRHEA
jgi:hypothetical protein